MKQNMLVRVQMFWVLVGFFPDFSFGRNFTIFLFLCNNLKSISHITLKTEPSDWRLCYILYITSVYNHNGFSCKIWGIL